MFLTLLLGLVFAVREAPAQPEASEVPKFCWSGRRSWFSECVCECDSEKQSCLHGWPACVSEYLYTHTLWYTYLQEHNTTHYFPALCIFFSSHLSVCEANNNHVNVLSFRELWTVMVLMVLFNLLQEALNFILSAWIWIIIHFTIFRR